MARMNIQKQFTETVGGLPRTFWIIWVGTLINRMGMFIAPFLALYLTTQLGYSITFAGWIVATFGAGSFISVIVGGWMADRFGRKATALTSFIGTGILMLGLGFVREPLVFALFVLPLGFFTDLYRPAVNALIADIAPSEDRTRAYGLVYWAINLGFSMAVVIAGYLAEVNYLLLFLGDGVTTLVFAVLIWLLVPETRPESTGDEDSAGLPISFRSFGKPLSDGLFMAVTLLFFLFILVMFQSAVALPLDVTIKGFTESDFGRIIAVNGIVIVLIGLPVARWVQHMPKLRVLAVSSLLVGCGFGLTFFATEVWMFMAAVVIWTLGEVSAVPVATALIADLAPEKYRGVYMGANNTAWGLGQFAANGFGAFILDSLGGGWLWGLCFAVGIVTSLGFLMLQQTLLQRTAAPETV